MTLLRRLGCLEIWFAVAVLAIAAAVSTSVAGQEAVAPPTDLPLIDAAG